MIGSYTIGDSKHQASLAPQENEEVRSLVTLLRERRRRRLEASGQRYESRPLERLTDDQTRHLSVAEVLRMGRRRVAAPDPLAVRG